MTALTTELGFQSANLRFRNSGTEEVMPLGKADASPSAKTGPNVMQAAGRVAWDLHKVGHAVRSMERAQAALDDAQARLSNPAATAAQRQKAEEDLHAAGQDLAIAHARFCMRAQMKDDYKTASESAKIEYHGNKRALGVSVASSTGSMAATVLGILTPVVVSASVTAGATAAAVALAATLYVGYQLSSGPSKDGEDKAKRAIVALAKSLDLLAGNAPKQQKARADAYRTYIAEKRAFMKPQVREQAKAKLLATLEEIARGDTVKDDLDPVKNWKDYAALRGQMAHAGGDAAAVAALEAAFIESHASQFKTSTVADAWKTPERMRFDSMGRLLLGKVSESLVSLHDFNAQAGRTGARDPRLAAASRAQMQGRRAEVKASLRDWLHFELAQSRMKAALAENDPVQARATLQTAAQALAAIENHDARDLFSPDARKQVEATKLAKASTIGERERYTMTNAGPAALAGAVNAFGATAGLGLTIEKDIAVSHGIHPQAKYGDQNDARLLVQGSAPVTAPYSAAERARFQKTGMSQLVDTLKRGPEPLVLKLDLAAANSMLIDLSDRHNDAELDKLLSAVETLKDVPDEIQFSIGGAKLASAKLSGTTGYYDWRYRQAPPATKAKFIARQAKMFADSVRVSVASPIAQAMAQIPLATTRRAVDRGNQMNAGVRERLTGLATRPNDDNGPPPPAAPGAGEATQEQVTPAHRDTVAYDDALARADTSLGAQTPPSEAMAGGEAPLRGETSVARLMPIPEEAVAPTFDPRAAALALRDIPELGQSERIAHVDMPAARPEAAFRPRPAQAASADRPGESQASPALADQRNMMMGTGRAETLQWFEQRGIRAAYNSGHGMDCLIISLLQHATGRYDTESEPELAELAGRYRAQLAQNFPEIDEGDRMLYDDELAIEALIRTINRDYHADMNVQLITPSTDGPVRFQPSQLGSQPVGIVMFGNHFQAVHRPAEEAPETGESESKNESEEASPGPRLLSRADESRMSGLAADRARTRLSAGAPISETAREAVRGEGHTSPPASLGSRLLNRADESRMSGLAAERARNRRRTDETPVAPAEENAFVSTPKRSSKTARERVKGWLSTSPHTDSMDAPDDDAFVRTPKRDSKAARKNVGAWLSASPHPDSMEAPDDDVFVPTPKRDRKAARENVEAWLSASPRPDSMEAPDNDAFVPTPKRDRKAARENVEAWLSASPRPDATNRPEDDAFVSTPKRDSKAARRNVAAWLKKSPLPGPMKPIAQSGSARASEAKPWWEAAPQPDSEEVIAERIRATFDSAHDHTSSEE
jgi:hypothetical protein